MKKLITITMMFLLFESNGCKKEVVNSESILDLKTELNYLAGLNVGEQINLEPCNDSNPYDAWGQALFDGFTKLSQAKSEYVISLLKDHEDFEKSLRVEIPQEYFYLDTTNVNLITVKYLCDEFLSLFIKRNIFEAIYISKKMEVHIYKSKILNQYDKAYLLKFVSLIRHSTYLNFTLSNLSKGISYRPFGACWRAGLQAIQDSGPFTKIACVIEWPICLAIIAGDCAYEQLTQ